ncbi:MAG: isopentenyl-diphosphate Delta-isomerase [Ginsengibacter sp.]
MNKHLILVDANDVEIGAMDKVSVHREGLLHRAFSVFVFNSKKELLLQQRAGGKYHSSLLWSNTCCSHPVIGESISETIRRRLEEEMGIKCATSFAFRFNYKINFENGLTEYEWDHVYFGQSDMIPTPDPDEVKDWKYMSLEALSNHIAKNPQHYTGWLNICLPHVIRHFKELYQ